MIKAIVFDLDGTLANTAGLVSGRREPSLLISGGVNNFGVETSPRLWGWSQETSDIPATLIERGYHVGIATRAPLAYASTLLHLIGADYEVLKASCGAGVAKAKVLIELCDLFHVAPHQMIYCGDLPEDHEIAKSAGVAFLDASALRDPVVLQRFPPLILGSGEGEVNNSTWDEPDTTSPSAVDCYLEFEWRASDAGSGPLRQSEIELAGRCLHLAPVQLYGGGLWDMYPSPTSEQMGFGPSGSRAAISNSLLSKHPALPYRRQLQSELFSHSGPIDSGEVLSDALTNRFGLLPQLVTRRELRTDSQLRWEYLSALRRIWPSLGGDADPSIMAVASYDEDGFLGSILGGAKHYRRHNSPDGRMRSGPEVMLDRIDFISDLIASRLQTKLERPIVPIPTSAYSDDQPGQFSIRVARRIADIAHRELVPVLRRVGDDYEVNTQFLSGSHKPTEVDLIEDQVTTGRTVSKCREVLGRAGISVINTYTYSANSRVLAKFEREETVTLHHRSDELMESHWGH